MATSSDAFPRLLVLGVSLAGLWLLLDKASAPSGETDRTGSNGPFMDVMDGAPSAMQPAPSGPKQEDGAEAPKVSVGSSPMQAPSNSIGQELNEQNREAIRLLEEKRFAEAETLFRKCLEADPDEVAFSANLAEALVRRAMAEFDTEPEVAFEALLEAIALVPLRQDLEGLRARWAKIVDAQEGFAEDQSQHFTLQYDGARDELLSRGYLDVLEDLEVAYQDYGEFFDIFPVEKGHEKFAVVLYDHDVFDTVTGIGEWAGGAFDGTIRVPVRNFQRDRNRIRAVLRHELVHAFIQEVGGKKVPGWLNEGLAQYLSPEGPGARALEVQAALKRMKGQTPLAFDSLAGTLAGLPDAKTIRMAYDQSQGLTNWLAFHYGERTLVSMVTGCKTGQTPAQSFERQMHFPLSDATRDFLDSL
jgi:tetratricopeptide (TPR) repeat protein